MAHSSCSTNFGAPTCLELSSEEREGTNPALRGQDPAMRGSWSMGEAAYNLSLWWKSCLNRWLPNCRGHLQVYPSACWGWRSEHVGWDEKGRRGHLRHGVGTVCSSNGTGKHRQRPSCGGRCGPGRVQQEMGGNEAGHLSLKCAGLRTIVQMEAYRSRY